jgi:hypothetical protein
MNPHRDTPTCECPVAQYVDLIESPRGGVPGWVHSQCGGYLPPAANPPVVRFEFRGPAWWETWGFGNKSTRITYKLADGRCCCIPVLYAELTESEEGTVPGWFHQPCGMGYLPPQSYIPPPLYRGTAWWEEKRRPQRERITTAWLAVFGFLFGGLLLVLGLVSIVFGADRRVDFYAGPGQTRTGYATLNDRTGRLDLYDAQSRRTGYGQLPSSGGRDAALYDRSGKRTGTGTLAPWGLLLREEERRR